DSRGRSTTWAEPVRMKLPGRRSRSTSYLIERKSSGTTCTSSRSTGRGRLCRKPSGSLSAASAIAGSSKLTWVWAWPYSCASQVFPVCRAPEMRTTGVSSRASWKSRARCLAYMLQIYHTMVANSPLVACKFTTRAVQVHHALVANLPPCALAAGRPPRSFDRPAAQHLFAAVERNCLARRQRPLPAREAELRGPAVRRDQRSGRRFGLVASLG